MPRANGATAELFHEPINWKKVAGIGLPVIGGSLILTGAALKFINGNETATAAKISNPEPRVDTKPIPEHTPPSLAKDSVVKNYMERYGLSGEVSDWKGMIDYVIGTSTLDYTPINVIYHAFRVK